MPAAEFDGATYRWAGDCGRGGLRVGEDGRMDQYGRYASDGRVLAAIERVLRGQAPGGPVRIPRDLAVAAVAAWSRDELDELAGPESDEQKRVRYQAAALALIGLSIQERSEAGGDAVLVGLDPELIAEAVAAGQAGAG